MVAHTAVLVVGFVVVATAASGQTVPALPRWDLSAQTGVFLARPSDQEGGESWDRWYQAANVGISTGRYLSPHVKLEGEVTFTTEGERYLTRLVQVPGLGPYPVSTEQRLRTTSASGALVCQFFENRWAHPFVFAGAALDVEQERLHTFPQFAYRSDPRIPGNEIQIAAEHGVERGPTGRVRGLIGAGAKLYVGPRAFFRTDARVGIGSQDSAHVSFRIGFGVDF